MGIVSRVRTDLNASDLSVTDLSVTDLKVIVTDRCQGCGACLLTCPEHAIRPQRLTPMAMPHHPRGRPLLVLDELCTGCGECIEVCPVDAIEEMPGTIEESPCVIEESSCAIK